MAVQINKKSTTRSQELYTRAKELIPGGTQLLAKRPEMFAPGQWPAYYQSANGCHIVDIDGNSFLDMSTTGIGSCLLGYADPDVNQAVMQCVQNGSMCSLNPPEEVALAERLLSLHPWAERARFLRTGGEAMSAAVRIARAAAGRDVVAFCGYHGWHDWYLAANRTGGGSSDQLNSHLLPGLSAAGVPSQLAGTAIPFAYNKIDELATIVEQNGSRLAAVVMEPTRAVAPQPGFLEGVRELCDRCRASLIIDEITAGWRFTLGGAHLLYGVQPDIAVFAKSLGNGYPMAAIVGRADVMEHAQGSFISSTYWTEAIGPTAALATIHKFQQVDVPNHVFRIGTLLREGMRELSQKHRIELKISGHPALTSMAFEPKVGLALMTLFTVRMLEHGILSGANFYPTLAHQPQHVDIYLQAADKVFAELSEVSKHGNIESAIGGPVRHSGFARLA